MYGREWILIKASLVRQRRRTLLRKKTTIGVCDSLPISRSSTLHTVLGIKKRRLSKAKCTERIHN